LHNLSELQKNFQAYLLNQRSKIKTAVMSTKHVSALERLDIYREAYYARLMDALCEDYPVLHALIGNEMMYQLTNQYIHHYPSSFRSIRWYGKNLATYMRETLHYSTSPWLIELAEFEWLLSMTFDVKDEESFHLEQMATIPPDSWYGLKFTLISSINKIKLNWNIVEIWKGFHEEDKIVSPSKSNEIENWIVWRKDNKVQFSSLLKEEMYVLDAMERHSHFGSICEGLCQWINEEEIAVYAASVLKRFIIDGVIREIFLN
jgi:hypothetical protein